MREGLDFVLKASPNLFVRFRDITGGWFDITESMIYYSDQEEDRASGRSWRKMSRMADIDSAQESVVQAQLFGNEKKVIGQGIEKLTDLAKEKRGVLSKRGKIFDETRKFVLNNF